MSNVLSKLRNQRFCPLATAACESIKAYFITLPSRLVFRTESRAHTMIGYLPMAGRVD